MCHTQLYINIKYRAQKRPKRVVAGTVVSTAVREMDFRFWGWKRPPRCIGVFMVVYVCSFDVINLQQNLASVWFDPKAKMIFNKFDASLAV